MPGTSVAANVDVSTYPALFRRVNETLLDGQRRIESQKIQTYWDTGRLIQTHILKNKDRAEYGAEVIGRLAEDLGTSRSVLTRCVQFFLKYPRSRIGAVPHPLSWGQYQELFSVSDDRERARLEEAIIKGGLSIEEIRARKKTLRSKDDLDASLLRAGSPAADPVSGAVCPVPALVPSRGELYTYQIRKRKVLSVGTGELVVDLGFSIVHNVEPRVLSHFFAEDIVESVPQEDACRFSRSGRTSKDLYTYKALIEKVVDADTLKVYVDLGFDIWVRQTLRLRGIDAPEVGTKAGDEARAFVRSLLKEADEIVICSSRSDKYDRYLADVFIPRAVGEDIFLNSFLLQKGLAVRYDG